MLLKLSTLFSVLFLSISAIFAQSNPEWKPIGLTVSGNNIQSGVEAFYQLNKCNKENVVFIKFINHNTFEVVVEWQDAVFTKNLKWVKGKNEGIMKKIAIAGDGVATGDCIDINQMDLVVNINDFIGNIDDFNLFGINSFKVSNKNK